MQSESREKLLRADEVIIGFVQNPEETRRLIEDQGATAPKNEQVKWKEAHILSITATTIYLFSFFIAQVCVAAFFGFYDPEGSKLPEWAKVLPYFAIWLLLFAGRWTLRNMFCEAIAEDAMPSSENQLALTAWLQRIRSKGCHWHIYVNLFSLRHIWLWTLIVASTATTIDYLAKGETGAMAFTQELARALLISLVAYIATNVVKEMLDMRARYQQSLQTMEQITATLNSQYEAIDGQTRKVNEATVQLGDQVNSVDKMTKALSAQAESIVANTQLEKGIKSLLREAASHQGTDQQSKLSAAVFKAFENFGKEANAIAERISGIKNDTIRQMYLNALNPYLQTELDAFDSHNESPKNRGIVTRFSAVGQMVRSLLVNCNELNVTFHALLVIPPARFLNYSHPPGFTDRWADLWLGDKDWNDYLCENFGVAQKGLVQRQFLVVTDGNGKNGNLSSEMMALSKKNITTQLGLWVECKDGSPVTNAKSGTDGKKWYRMEKDKPESGSWERLADILGKVFHKESNCFIREIAAELLTAEPLSGIGKLLKDADTQKPYDYFAARCKQTKEWLFCLRMRYDKDFDVAILEILYASEQNQSEWGKTKDDLNALFPDSPSAEIVEIMQYANLNPTTAS